MWRILATLLLLLAGLGAASAQTPSAKEDQHKATLEIVMQNAAKHEGAGCSATAIGPHTLLTAQHCNIDGGTIYFNQNSRPLANGQVVAEKYFDNNDHMLLVIPSVVFKHYITYDASKVRKMRQGEHLYFWGNPALIMNQYREVYATGVFPGLDTEGLNAAGPFEMVSGPVVGGDSGSAIFSAEDGQLVGITTWGLEYGAFLGSYPLQFTQEQIDQATGVGMITYLPDTRPQVIVNVAPSKATAGSQVDLSVVEAALIAIVLLLAAGIFVAVIVLANPFPYVYRALKYVGRLLLRIARAFINVARAVGSSLKKV